jgi:LmbE family N-acetylglucosaminyl deacetylase
MSRRLFVSLALLLIPLSALARQRAVRHPGSIPIPASMLWVGAHPDDEAVVAPLLSMWCREEQVRCTFLVLTRGAEGACLRPDGCLPDVATVRSGEAGAASQYFGADSILLNLPDGGGVHAPQWPADVVSTVAGYIEAVRPELILTFDPRHGTTCHPDHREAARIVLEAVERVPEPPTVYLLESRVTISPEPFTIHFSSATPAAQRFDADASQWDAIVEDMKRHPSQFDERYLTAIRNVPPSERSVFIAPARLALGWAVGGCE